MTTVSDLRLLTGSPVEEVSDESMSFFITQADTIITELFAGSTISTGILSQIGLYLAGHYYVLSAEGGGITYRRAGQSEERFKSFGFDGVGFQTTRFGQMACALDTTGKLVAMSLKDRPQFSFVSYSNKRSAEKLSGEGT